MMTEMNSN